MDYDVIIVWINVHGGSYHKLIHLHELLKLQGLNTLVLLNSDAPYGLQAGLDFNESHWELLAKSGVLIGGIDTIQETLSKNSARMVLFDANKTPFTQELIDLVREKHDSKTGEIASLLGDFSYHSTDFIFIQSLMALWFLMDYGKGRKKKRSKLAQVKKVYLSGNIFFEPVVNTWTSSLTTKEALYEKYGLDQSRPLCLWLPDRADSLHPSFKKVVDFIDSANMNIIIKLHPWEYKQYIHGFDTFGTGKTASQRWAIAPLEEKDSSWAYKFCDMAIFRGSAVGLELPFWEKPGICIWPEDDYRTILSRDSSMRISTVEELPKALVSEKIQLLTDCDYENSRKRLATLWQDNSFTQLIECIMDALKMPPDLPTIGSADPLRKLFLGQIPWAMLKGEHYGEHLWARLGGSLTRPKTAPPFLYTNVYPDFPKA